jgi:endonuclease IV
MPPIGFSTGALFKGDFISGIETCRALGLQAIELSALRHKELEPLTEFAVNEGPNGFCHVSVHAPTDFSPEQENIVVESLLRIAHARGWPIVVHPDCFHDLDLWDDFGKRLCIENMDKRKPAGRTAEELGTLFERFPTATLCFDIAHAQQVDTSLAEAYRILRDFGSRICQVHVSQVATDSRHERLSDSTVDAFREIASLIPRDAPVILETPVAPAHAAREVRQATRIFAVAVGS